MDVVVKGLLVACVALCIAFGVSRCQYKDLETYVAEYETAIQKELLAVNLEARAIERANVSKINDLGTTYEEKINEIKESHSRELADAIKSRTVILRDHWQVQPVTELLPGTCPTSGQLNAAEQLRAEDLGHLREIAALADKKEQALQEYALICSGAKK